MNITDVRVRPLTDAKNLVAVASVTFDNEFVVHDIKIVSTANGLILAMPSRKTNDGEYKDICHPLKQEVRDYIVDTVMEK